MRDLILYHDDDSVFADYTDDARDYLRDDFVLDFTNAEDFIYIGLYKPFNKLYLELNTPALANANLVVEYWNGTAYQSINLKDDSKGLTRSGFMSFEKPEDWSEVNINSDSKYYIRLSADSFTATVQGLNIVYSDDNDLMQEVRCIHDFTQGSDTTFIAYHLSARNDIIQTLRNGGSSTKVSDKQYYNNLTKWDLLEMGEVRQASKYLTLYKIFFDASENSDDKHYQNAMDYKQRYGEAFKLYRMSVDKNDDGKADDEERTQIKGIQLFKR